MKILVRFAFVLFLWVTLLFLPTGNVFTAGQDCCDDPYQYNPDNALPYDCVNISQWGPAHSVETNCYPPTEICIDNRICSEPIAEIVSCCDDWYQYNPDNALPYDCVNVSPWRPAHSVETNCSETQVCVNNNCVVGSTPVPQNINAYKLCDFITDSAENELCDACVTNNRSWTAIGCIHTDIAGFFRTILTFGMGIAGGIAFLLILLGGFQILTSAGNPEQLNAGKELIGSAIAGLLLIIFSVFFLKIIGVDILGIPEWIGA